MKGSGALALAIALSVAVPGMGVPADRGPGEPLLKPVSGGEMVPIPGGEFVMGDAAGRADEAPHAVRVGPFFMDRYPVTQDIYRKVMGKNPSGHSNGLNPVEQVQWTDAARFCNACSVMDGLEPCYAPKTLECDFGANGYRLPTEAEWEYACRAGGRSRYCFGDNASDLPRYAWFKGNSGGAPHPVGKKAPNAFGLFDMHGNVWEWCNDWYGADPSAPSAEPPGPSADPRGPASDPTGPSADPRGPTSGKMRVLRGGAWDSPPEKCRSAYRFKEFPTVTDVCFGFDSYGFRRVRGRGKARAGAPAARTASVAPAKGLAPAATAGAVAVTDSGAAGVPAGLKGTICFVSDRGGALDIWKMRADGANPVNLTNDSHADADPRFSPDGNTVMYTSLRGGFPEVRMMIRDGSDNRRVTAGSQPDWSPDGGNIVFIRDNQAFVRGLSTGKERLLNPGAWERCGVPAWSPDGARIAVASRHTGDIGIFILETAGTGNRALKGAEPACTPRWSGDGTRLLCQTVKGHICEVGVDGTGWVQLTFGADVQHHPCYSPDGKTLLFCRAPSTQGPWQVWAVGLGKGGAAPVKLTTKGSSFMPDWDAREE